MNAERKRDDDKFQEERGIMEESEDYVLSSDEDGDYNEFDD